MSALAGLTLVVMIALTLFSFLYTNIFGSLEKNEMELKSYQAFEQLLSRGEPANWQTLNLSEIMNFGIEKENSVLDESKILALNSTLASNASLVKDRLGISKYNFSLEISDFYTAAQLYSIGSASSNKTISMQYISTLNGSLVLVRMKVAG